MYYFFTVFLTGSAQTENPSVIHGYRHRFKDAVDGIAEFEFEFLDRTLCHADDERIPMLTYQFIVVVQFLHTCDDTFQVVSGAADEYIAAQNDILPL